MIGDVECHRDSSPDHHTQKVPENPKALLLSLTNKSKRLKKKKLEIPTQS